MAVPDLNLSDWKTAFRKRGRAARAAAAATARSGAAHEAAHHLMRELIPSGQQVVAIYHPVADEMDTAPLAEALIVGGHAVVLPVVSGADAPLTFRLFELARELKPGKLGIPEPPEDAKVLVPNIVIAPLVAVRRDGARLGMGGGYYDRTLAELRAQGAVTVIGFGYAAQMMDRFPVGPHDQFLDAFVSEDGVTRFEPRR